MTEKKHSIKNSTGYLVTRLARTIERDFETRLASLAITRAGFAVLSAIYHDKKSKPADLAAFIGVDGALITRHIKKLEKLGYIEKIVSALDRRSFDLNLTPAGESVVLQGRECSRETNQKFTQGINTNDIVLFQEIMEKMLLNADNVAKDL